VTWLVGAVVIYLAIGALVAWRYTEDDDAGWSVPLARRGWAATEPSRGRSLKRIVRADAALMTAIWPGVLIVASLAWLVDTLAYLVLYRRHR